MMKFILKAILPTLAVIVGIVGIGSKVFAGNGEPQPFFCPSTIKCPADHAKPCITFPVSPFFPASKGYPEGTYDFGVATIRTSGRYNPIAICAYNLTQGKSQYPQQILLLATPNILTDDEDYPNQQWHWYSQPPAEMGCKGSADSCPWKIRMDPIFPIGENK